MHPITWETALNRFPLASDEVQVFFDTSWRRAFAEHFHSVHEVGANVFAVADEDLDDGHGDNFSKGKPFGPGFVVFPDPRRVRNYLYHAITIKYSVGWSIKLRLAVTKLEALVSEIQP